MKTPYLTQFQRWCYQNDNGYGAFVRLNFAGQKLKREIGREIKRIFKCK